MNKALNLSKLILVLILWLFLSLISTSTLALSSDWVFNDKSKVRLISSKNSVDNVNQIVLGLEYELEPGWKTY